MYINPTSMLGFRHVMMDPLQIYTDYYIVHMVKKLKKKMKKEGMIFYSVPYE